MTENNLQERITLLRKQRGIMQKDVAREIGVYFGTYQKWEHKGHPSRKNIDKLISFYGCSEVWLLTGNGNPFPDSNIKYQDSCDSAADTPAVMNAHSPPGQYSASPNDSEISVAHDLLLAAKVLESKTHYAMSLHMNIRSFSSAVAESSRLSNVLSRLDSLESEFKIMKQENKSLHTEISRLKEIHHDENPSGGDGGSTPVLEKKAI